MEDAKRLRRLSCEHWAAGRLEEATEEAWTAYRLEPQERDSKLLLVGLLHRSWKTTNSDRKPELIQLLKDREIDPDAVSLAACALILQDPVWQSAAKTGDFGILAAHFEEDELCQTLLRESPVYVRVLERRLTSVRRWLLRSGEWQKFQRLVEALVVQATLNGGAWPFDDKERVLLDQSSGHRIVAAYFPVRESTLSVSADDSAEQSVTRTVAGDYERWPYPVWQRITVQPPGRMPDLFRGLDPGGGPDSTPANGKWLIAGCGTGREPASIATTFPEAIVTAIDVSETSLAYAKQKCAELEIRNIRFLKLDLHNIADLNEQFDIITSSGVLHHLPDPERGWEALVSSLRPGGLMKIMLYSRFGYPNVAADPDLIGDLMNGPVSDDTIRKVRHRLMERTDSKLARSIVNTLDFGTLAGTRDLVLHTQVHLFDVPRIARALERFELRLVSFVLPRPDMIARYDTMFPHDRMHHDVEAWAKFEEKESSAFRSMYDFWCRKAHLA